MSRSPETCPDLVLHPPAPLLPAADPGHPAETSQVHFRTDLQSKSGIGNARPSREEHCRCSTLPLPESQVRRQSGQSVALIAQKSRKPGLDLDWRMKIEDPWCRYSLIAVQFSTTCFLRMLDLRTKIVKSMDNLKATSPSPEILDVPVSTVRNVIKKFTAHGTVANLPGRGWKGKIGKRRVVQNSSRETH